MALRDYQEEALSKIKEHYYRGERRLLGVAATGLGKTKIFSHIYDVIPRKGKMLVLVNREELVEQCRSAIEAANPGFMVGIEQASNFSTAMDDVVVASVQTIGNTKVDEDGDPVFNKRILRLNPDEFDVIVVDESHHALATSFKRVMQFMRVYKADERFNDPNKLLLCVTATPNRADGKGLEEVCDDIAFVKDIRWGIENGWLCDIEAYKVNTRIDINDVKTTRGDLDQRQLANKINIPERNKLVVEKYLEIAKGKKAVFFCLDIAHAKAIAEELEEAGVKALPMYSGMTKEYRQMALAKHKSGEIQVLTNASLLTEGYDDPTIEVICMVRPTKSNVLYTQAIGRGLRPYPAPEARANHNGWIKDTCVVIDFVDVTSRHSLITVPTLFGLNSALDLKGKKAIQTLQEIEEEIKKIPENKRSLVQMDQFDDLTKLSGHIEKIDLLAPPTTPPEIAEHSELSWVSSGNGYTLSTPENTYHVTQNTLGNFNVYTNKKGLQVFMGSAHDFQSAIKMAESKLDDNQYQFSKNNATWKNEPPTQSQIDLLCKIDRGSAKMFKSKDEFAAHLRKMTKWQLSAMISEKLSKRSSA
jgi:ATP-dependent helicase IRC3